MAVAELEHTVLLSGEAESRDAFEQAQAHTVRMPVMQDILKFLTRHQETVFPLFDGSYCFGQRLMQALNPDATEGYHAWERGSMLFPGERFRTNYVLTGPVAAFFSELSVMASRAENHGNVSGKEITTLL